MYKHEQNKSRCPLGDRIVSFMISAVLVLNITTCTTVRAVDVSVEDIQPTPVVIANVPVSAPDSKPGIKPEPALKSNEEIVSEINSGLWGNGEERKTRLIEAGYDYDAIQCLANTLYPSTQKVTPTYTYTGGGLTKRGGVYWNPNTGLKETWYSQKVLPGGGLNIPGRHVNDEGFVCDGDGYICVASSTYAKGTIIETSRGMGKVYDAGCAPGVLDVYVNW